MRRSALGNMKDNSEVVAALGDAAQHDPFWGIRVESLRALGKIGTSNAEQAIMPELHDEKPWVREVAVQQLGNFQEDAGLAGRLETIASSEVAYRVRAAALEFAGLAESAGRVRHACSGGEKPTLRITWFATPRSKDWANSATIKPFRCFLNIPPRDRTRARGKWP